MFIYIKLYATAWSWCCLKSQNSSSCQPLAFEAPGRRSSERDGKSSWTSGCRWLPESFRTTCNLDECFDLLAAFIELIDREHEMLVLLILSSLSIGTDSVCLKQRGWLFRCAFVRLDWRCQIHQSQRRRSERYLMRSCAGGPRLWFSWFLLRYQALWCTLLVAVRDQAATDFIRANSSASKVDTSLAGETFRAAACLP